MSSSSSINASPLEDGILPSSEDFLNDQSVRKLIECPICFSVPLGPIYLCERGHVVCFDCRIRTKSCSLCRGIYSEARNYLMEAIVEKTTLPCKYWEQGCTQVMTGEALVHHVKVCDHRPVSCQYCPCNNLVHLNEYLTHLIDTHNIYGTNGSSGTAIYDGNINGGLHEGCVIPYYFIDGHHNFLLQMHVRHSRICTYVTYLGAEANCKDFHVTIECHVFDISDLTDDDSFLSIEQQQHQRYQGRRKQGNFFEWSGQPASCREVFENDIFMQGKGLIIPAKIVCMNGRLLAHHQSRWAYHVNIVPCHGLEAGSSSSSSFSSNSAEENVENHNSKCCCTNNKSSSSPPPYPRLTSFVSTALRKFSSTLLFSSLHHHSNCDGVSEFQSLPTIIKNPSSKTMKFFKLVTIFGFGLTLAWAVMGKKRL